MPISVGWFDEDHTIAIYHIENHWAIRDLANHLKAHLELGLQQPHYYIVDMSQSNMLPSGILAQHNEYSQFFCLSDGLTAVIDAPRLAIIAIKILAQLGVKLHDVVFVDNINQALEAIKNHQQTTLQTSQEL